jgi:hypothetical protein
MLVAAPSKTPRAAGDRVKTDRKDAELFARLLLAGQLKPVTVPPTGSRRSGIWRAPASTCGVTWAARATVSRSCYRCTAASIRERRRGPRRIAADLPSRRPRTRPPSWPSSI